MLKKFEINGVHRDVDAGLRKYVTKKIGGLDRYMPRPSRDCAHVEVHLKEGKAKPPNHCSCEVKLHLPKQTIIIKEDALNMYAAVDIVEAKLKMQLKKYKDLHGSGKMHRHLVGRLRQRNV